jgi:hypothetical protein
MRNAKKYPFIPLHAPIFIKLINFNKKVVSDVTSETTFSLKSIYLMKKEDERGMKGACVAPLIIYYGKTVAPWSMKLIIIIKFTRPLV